MFVAVFVRLVSPHLSRSPLDRRGDTGTIGSTVSFLHPLRSPVFFKATLLIAKTCQFPDDIFPSFSLASSPPASLYCALVGILRGNVIVSEFLLRFLPEDDEKLVL